jgi:hypothetical protein
VKGGFVSVDLAGHGGILSRTQRLEPRRTRRFTKEKGGSILLSRGKFLYTYRFWILGPQ